MRTIVQHLCGPQDRNGNPRRLWVEYSGHNGNILTVIEEGYAGRPECCDSRKVKCVEVPEVNISAGEYNSWKRNAKASGTYVAR